MARSTAVRGAFVSTFLLGALFALSACAAPVEAAPSPSEAVPSPSPSPTPYAGPVAFVGDELELVLPTAEELTGVLAGATDVGAPSSHLEQISDGGGPQPAPAICMAPFAEQSLSSVGARTMSWTVPDGPRGTTGQLSALQFADEAQATERMDQLVAAAQQCGQFDYNGPASFEAVVKDDSEHARALAGTLSISETEGGWSEFEAFAAVGNVVIHLRHPVGGDTAVDADAVATLLQDQAEDAYVALVDDLTANPPAPEAESTPDAAAPWNEWEITAAGVGPIRLGDTIDVATAAVADAEVTEPEFEGLPWTLTNAAGTASLLILAREGGDTVVAITAGNERTLDDSAQDGSALPARGDIRVGGLLSQAVAAFPGGTTVDIVSSGDSRYEVATRDGRLFTFHADRGATDADATIVGISVEDATTRRGLVFE